MRGRHARGGGRGAGDGDVAYSANPAVCFDCLPRVYICTYLLNGKQAKATSHVFFFLFVLFFLVPSGLSLGRRPFFWSKRDVLIWSCAGEGYIKSRIYVGFAIEALSTSLCGGCAECCRGSGWFCFIQQCSPRQRRRLPRTSSLDALSTDTTAVSSRQEHGINVCC